MLYKQDHLRQSELFAELDERSLDVLAEYAENRHFVKGHLIVLEGATEVENLGLCVIISGGVEITRRMSDGSQFQLAVLGPGDCFGELSVIDGQPRSASAVAVEDTECLMLTAIDFREFLQISPKVAHNLLRVIVGRLRQTDEMIVD